MSIHYQDAPDGGRYVIATCELCRNRFDGLHQHKDVAGQWSPDPAPTLATMGWIGDRFCGRHCAVQFEHARARTPEVVPVTTVRDKFYEETRLAAVAKQRAEIEAAKIAKQRAEAEASKRTKGARP